MITFDDLWKLLYDHGGIDKNRVECNNLWDELSPSQRDQLFNTISNKLNIGKFVHYDPLRAMRENIRRFKPLEPEFLTGRQQEQNWKKGIHMVQVIDAGLYKICTRETADKFHLHIHKDPW